MVEDKHDFEESNEEENFADMLEQSLAGIQPLAPGQQVEATVLQIGDQWIFLDVGQKGEGVLDRRELADEEGQLNVAQGDRIKVFFLSRAGGELRFTTRLASGSAGAAQIEEAWRSGIPVDGRLEKEVKGGFEVRLAGGVRAFCPFSQLGLRRDDSSETAIGENRSFKVIQFGEQGRNVVVSHRAILEEERARQRETLRETLQEGMVVKGTVTSLRDFGAFIDIGGLEGLLPISEISYGRVENIEDVLHVGQELELAIKKLDWQADRFSFSLRDTQADPWSKVGTLYMEGSTHTGTVARLANFGAFVTLEEGVDGLIHISKLGGGRRINHPREVLEVGQQLLVTIEQVDREQHRISLAPAADGAESAAPTRYVEKDTSGSMGTFADLLKGKFEKKGKKRK
ncbi:RNA-binding S1 domain protein [Syntrophotalea carbinolica DSM 2380]|uniref:RNA-binding S1 domain protein n=1 Tax=Syntrophotalea carbinolica (strain DSM 2380 / NBRC 103641 / GraBd1) TaxID=338963 RepID=Q3A149_SYNC1|nr:30S ribosomal protein S1 [Syntrophotalea carbinolica]ABA89908.1 RNA-binding S1 domain protein [Syntrophotalea carbinolica DSM 2380]